MNKPSFLSGTALIAIVGLATAGCQTTAPDRFARADKNQDGQLGREEINENLVVEVFQSRDANGDKRLTMAEWLVDNDKGQERIFRDRDANADGVVTLEEALAYGRTKGAADRLIRGADTNHDGQLSRQEMTTYYGSKE
jgi:Ca2+-binding EF-hand superfamily protein